MPVSDLLTYKGHPVPYITAWSGEHLPLPRVVATRDGINFDDLAYARRDPAGMLWQPWALREGDGVPEFRTIHGPRQRRAMRRLLCQVCGGPSDLNEQGRLWLLNRQVVDSPEGEVTTHPPVCLGCAPLAARLCPHLKGNAMAVRVGRVTVDSVLGQLYTRGVPYAVPTEKTVVFLDSPQARWMVGSQLAATLGGCTIVDLPEDTPDTPSDRAGGRR